jgi:UDP:flavonoid glycosyltransferase YjiC (YdhE family)
VAVAAGLQRAGHRVTLAAPASAAALAQAYGVSTHPVRFDMQTFVQQPEIQAVLNGRNIFRQLRLLRTDMRAGMVQALADFWEATAGADYVVASGVGLNGLEAASRRGVPLAYASLAPFTPATRAFPSFMLPVRTSLGGGYNYLTYGLILRALWPVLAGPLNAWRAAHLKLPAWRSIEQILKTEHGPGTAWLYGFSPSVLPKPPDWQAEQHVTGYWFLDAPAGWQPPVELLRFLDAGPPPVYVGFGSLRPADPERLTRLSVRALELSGQRGVLLTGGRARAASTSRLFYVDDVPHSWLFPRMAAVVHHGGAGTTGAGLRAGVPSIITPFIGDQFAWAEQVVKRGAGPPAGPAKQLTAEKLARRIQLAVHDAGLRERAAALGEKVRAEDGVAAAVAVIERHAAGWTSSDWLTVPAGASA